MLVAPSEAYRHSYLAAVAELAAEGDVVSITGIALGEQTFAAALARWADDEVGRDLAPHRVPSTERWLVEAGHYIGRVSIRHALNDYLREIGGHIGYGIRPSRRRQGHGTRILQLALPIAHGLGVDPALVTCDADNLASRKIIEHAGGVLEQQTAGTLRFWIRTAPDGQSDRVR